MIKAKIPGQGPEWRRWSCIGQRVVDLDCLTLAHSGWAATRFRAATIRDVSSLPLILVFVAGRHQFLNHCGLRGHQSVKRGTSLQILATTAMTRHSGMISRLDQHYTPNTITAA
jgi:hypothetical protein